METVYPYPVVYLAGIATPFIILRGLIGDKDGDGSGCLLNFCIAGIAVLTLLVTYFRIITP